LPISSLSARPDLPDDPVIPYNGFATVQGERAFFRLFRKENIDVNWAWDQAMRAIITDPLYEGEEDRAAEADYLESRTFLVSRSPTLARSS